jgi:RHS repeat-associated protein
LTAINGSSTDTYIYDAWGNLLSGAGSTVNVFRFEGKFGYYFDSDIGEYFLRARYYAPTVGRFVSLDPVLSLFGGSLFKYVGNNPVFASDPSGMEPPYYPDPYQGEAQRGKCPSESNYKNWTAGGAQPPLGGAPEGCLWAFIKTKVGCCATEALTNTIKIFYSTLTKTGKGKLSCHPGAEDELNNKFDLAATIGGGALGNDPVNCRKQNPKVTKGRNADNPRGPKDCAWFEMIVTCDIACNPSANDVCSVPPCPNGSCFVADGKAEIRFVAKPGVNRKESEFVRVTWSTSFLNPDQCQTSPCKVSVTPQEVGGNQV